MTPRSWQGWQSWGASSGSWDAQKWEGANSKSADTEPVLQESTWSGDEETVTRLIFNLEGKHCSALTGEQLADEQSQYATKSGTRRVCAEGRICVREM